MGIHQKPGRAEGIVERPSTNAALQKKHQSVDEILARFLVAATLRVNVERRTR
jgi:hypothetical protein